jgi:hypothetical protein
MLSSRPTELDNIPQMNNRSKIAFGGSVDISARVSGATDALGTLGLNPQLKELNKTPLGMKTEKAPKLKPRPESAHTTSGALLNPTVASMEPAPNYGDATSDRTSCGACKAFSKEGTEMGQCDKFKFYPRSDFTCDSWASKTGASRKHL